MLAPFPRRFLPLPSRPGDWRRNYGKLLINFAVVSSLGRSFSAQRLLGLVPSKRPSTFQLPAAPPRAKVPPPSSPSPPPPGLASGLRRRTLWTAWQQFFFMSFMFEPLSAGSSRLWVYLCATARGELNTGHDHSPYIICHPPVGTHVYVCLRGLTSGPHRWETFWWAPQLGMFGLNVEPVLSGGYAKKDCTRAGPSKSALLCSTLIVLLSHVKSMP